MLRLILRQILKHRLPLLILTLVWVVGGTLIFQNSHRMLAWLSSATVDLPEPGREEPVKAMSYLQSARDRVQSVRLDLMARTCTDFLPLQFTGEARDYRPHWLDRLSEWQIQTEDGLETVEPDRYWSQHVDNVLLALRDALSALQFAYEIDARDLGEAGQPTIVVADEVARLARAVCRPQLGMLAYGDYAEFLETRAWLQLSDGKPQADFDDPLRPIPADLGPGERERLVLERLRGVPEYLRALRMYLGGAPGDCESDGPAFSGGYDLRLACLAPLEAIEVYAKLLRVSPATDAPALHRDLGLTRLIAAGGQGSQRNRAAPDSRAAQTHREAAIEHFILASGAYETEFDARVELARLYLQRATELETLRETPAASAAYALAHDEVRQIALLNRRGDFREDEFRELARRTLMGLGRFRDADCYAPMRNLGHGTRAHCEKLNL